MLKIYNTNQIGNFKFEYKDHENPELLDNFKDITLQERKGGGAVVGITDFLDHFYQCPAQIGYVQFREIDSYELQLVVFDKDFKHNKTITFDINNIVIYDAFELRDIQFIINSLNMLIENGKDINEISDTINFRRIKETLEKDYHHLLSFMKCQYYVRGHQSVGKDYEWYEGGKIEIPKFLKDEYILNIIINSLNGKIKDGVLIFEDSGNSNKLLNVNKSKITLTNYSNATEEICTEHLPTKVFFDFGMIYDKIDHFNYLLTNH